MCARFVFINLELLVRHFGSDSMPGFEGSFNNAPTDYTPVIQVVGGKRRSWPMRWGLIPSWAKDDSNAVRCINSRVDTVEEKASFRGAIKYHRCVVPLDGFYEWQGLKGYKQPYYIFRADGQPMGVAGIFEEWESPAGTVESFAILTTEANREMSDIHERMPVILEQEDFGRWLDPGITEVSRVRDLMVPARDGTLVMYPVGKAVGNPRAEGPELIVPVSKGTLF